MVELDRKRVTDITCMAGISLAAGVKWVHIVSIYKSLLSRTEGSAKPILVTIAGKATRDRILLSAIAIFHVTGGRHQTVPNGRSANKSAACRVGIFKVAV